MAILQKTGITGSLSISSSGIRPTTSASLFNVNGYNGRLLSVVDTLSGSLFSVNSIAGLPIFEVFSNNRVVAGKYAANDFVISGSRVGIGTTIPGYKLEVSGEAYISTRVISDRFASVTNGNNNSILFSSNTTSLINNSSTALYINSNGSVGIGTTSPTGMFEIYKSTPGGLGGTLILNNDGTIVANETAIIFGDGNVNNRRAAISSTTEGSPFYGDIKFKTGLSAYGSLNTRMIILGNGNVGIGTTSPSSLLNIRASVPTSTGTVTTGTNLLIDSNTSNYITFRNTGDNATYAGLTFLDNNTGGYVVFRNYASNDVIAGSDCMIYGTYQDHIFQNGTSETINAKPETMRIKQNGSVGIGANSPNAKLHISSSTTTNLRIETKLNSGTDVGTEFVGPDTHSYALGLDNSDGNKFKISYAASRTPPNLGTNDRFIIQTNGNIGVGVSTASSKFHVLADSVANANQPGINGLFACDVDGRNLLRVQNTNTSLIAAAAGSGISLQSYSKTSNQPATNTHEAQLLLLANNNSLTGTTVLIAPTDFQVNVSASNVNMAGTNYSNYGSFSTYFKRDGNVGVGTFTPTYKLDVSGSSVWSTTTRIDARIGNAAIGRHPYWGDYAYFSHAALDNTVQNNYLVLQYKDGSAYFNAPLNKLFYFVNNGNNYVANVNATGIAIGKTLVGANYSLDVTGSATFTGKLGIGGSPGTGKVYVNAGGTSNPFLTVANALGTADTTTSGYAARGFIAIDLGASVITGRTGTHYIQVFSKP